MMGLSSPPASQVFVTVVVLFGGTTRVDDRVLTDGERFVVAVRRELDRDGERERIRDLLRLILSLDDFVVLELFRRCDLDRERGDRERDLDRSLRANLDG